eukprot:6180070-Pleurochrysis_carterae.AAC.2
MPRRLRGAVLIRRACSGAQKALGNARPEARGVGYDHPLLIRAPPSFPLVFLLSPYPICLLPDLYRPLWVSPRPLPRSLSASSSLSLAPRLLSRALSFPSVDNLCELSLADFEPPTPKLHTRTRVRFKPAPLRAIRVQSGGGTRFNDLGVTVPAVKGSAVLWPSVQSDDPTRDEPFTNHEVRRDALTRTHAHTHTHTRTHVRARARAHTHTK